MPLGLTFVKSTALLCAGLSCQPALYGRDTPVGTYTTQRVYNTKTRRSSIMFTRLNGKPLTIHRVWLGAPSQRRLERLASATPSDNMVSAGCINVSDATFRALWQYPDGTLFVITER